MTAAFFITGTGTDIGKTLVMTTLCWQLKQRGFTVTALKPVVSGFDAEDMQNDSALILKSCGLTPNAQMMKTISPWQFAAPLSPNIAAAREKKYIVFDEVIAFCEEHEAASADIVLAEGAGGIMTPLDDRHTMLDCMEELRWPVILVGGTYLGAISHMLTSLEVLKARRIPVAAFIVNESDKSDVTLAETVEGLSSLVPASIAIVKLPRARPQPELWKHIPNISWVCGETREKKSHV